ncbi:MAG TPA: transcriptional repressor [Gemmataceae bacterium]|nr:transcriptional repressor [Gemmataceae bacterium]
MNQRTATALPAEPESAALRRALADAGWRFTRQRAAVFEYLHSTRDHATAEQVYVGVRRHLPNISLATVYKALEALVDARLVNKLPDATGPARYDCRSEAHYHFRCLKTGKLCDLPTPFDRHLLDKLDPHLVESLRQQGFQVTGHRLELLGHFEEV